MNKRTVFLFILVVALGILLIDSFMFGDGFEEDECSCIDSQAMWLECDCVCLGFGGCSEPWYLEPGECGGINACEHKVINWCNTPSDKCITGYHLDFNCGECGRII